MRRRCAVTLAAAVWLSMAANAAAAQARRCPAGVDEVSAERRVVWCAPSRDVRVASRVVWSDSRHAIAFATESRVGALTLEVVLVAGRELHNVSWELPDVRRSPRRGAPVITWLGPQRLAFGFSEIRPALVASFTPQ